jgi:sulfur relay (sulfurtransferase) complex TusBCD TusD component (DsrE family)
LRKSFTIFLSSSPYSNESVLSATRIFSDVIKKGHEAILIASGEGVCAFQRSQKYSGLPDAEKLFAELIDNGLKVYLCGGCLGYRRVAKHDYLRGVEVVKAKTCMKVMEKSDILINL